MAENRMSHPLPWNLVANGYVTEVVPVFNKWAIDSIRRVNPQPVQEVVDIAAGPGTVSFLLSPLVKRVVALDFSPQMLRCLKSRQDTGLFTNVHAGVCDGQRLPCKSASFDLAFSQFGLMFFPDRMVGFREMHRVLKPGGRAVVYSWAPVSDSPAMKMMIGAMLAGFPQARPKEHETKTIVTGLDDLNTFRLEMTAAGFSNVHIEAITHSYPVMGPQEFWESMVKGSAPVTLMKSGIDAQTWNAQEKLSIRYLEENLPKEVLTSTAYLGIGSK